MSFLQSALFMSDEPLINGKEEGILAADRRPFPAEGIRLLSLGKDDAAAEFFAVYTARRKVKCRRIELDAVPAGTKKLRPVPYRMYRRIHRYLAAGQLIR